MTITLSITNIDYDPGGFDFAGLAVTGRHPVLNFENAWWQVVSISDGGTQTFNGIPANNAIEWTNGSIAVGETKTLTVVFTYTGAQAPATTPTSFEAHVGNGDRCSWGGEIIACPGS